MLVSSNKRRVRLSLALAGLACLTGPGFAAEAPISLFPPPAKLDSAPAESGVSEPVLIQSPNFEPAAQPGSYAGRPVSQGITVDTLSAPDFNSVGVLGANNGGLGIAMWRGTSPVVVQRLLPAIPAAAPSYAMRDLARRLLLSVATSPQTTGEDAAALPPLLFMRAERLYAMADIKGLGQLLDAAPAPAVTADIQALKADSLLAEGEAEAACALPASGDRAVFCQILAGRTDQAALSLDLLREQGEADGLFGLVAEAMMGNPVAAPESLPHPTALNLAALRQAKLPVPKDAVQTDRPLMLRALALAPHADQETRLLAAEKAARSGAVSPQDLADLYNAVSFDPAELQQPLVDTALADTARHRALRFQAARLQPSPLIQARLITQALALAHDLGNFPVAARLYAPLVANIQPGPEMLALAGDAARALFLVGDSEKARLWIVLARSMGAAEPQAAALAARLWPLERLAGSLALNLASALPRDIPQGVLAAFRKSLGGPADQVGHTAILAQGLLAAMGHMVSEADWVAVMTDSAPVATTMPAAPLSEALKLATADKRVGETVLLSLVILGQDGPQQLDPATLFKVVAGLREIGLAADARALAIETLIAAGL